MKKIIVFLILGLMLMMPIVAALSLNEARQEWRDLKDVSRGKRVAHRENEQRFQGDKSPENDAATVESGKESLHAALNEAESWLVMKDIEAGENKHMPDDLKERIQEDVDRNLATIDELRSDVDGTENRLGVGIVWLKTVGKYIELTVDVSRNSGLAWVHVANEHANRIEDYQNKLRVAAEKIDNNEAILEELDNANVNLEEARTQINEAERYYNKVEIGNTPLVNYGEGNQHLREGRQKLIDANVNIRQAWLELFEVARA